jgi:hypothetical protein
MNGLATEALLKLIEDNGRKLNNLGVDYDYSRSGSVDDRGHSSDAGKLPWHPTYSNQSDYATGSVEYPGGTWSRDFQGDIFRPSVRQTKIMTPEAYAGYFSKVEPDTRLDITNYVNPKIDRVKKYLNMIK